MRLNERLNLRRMLDYLHSSKKMAAFRKRHASDVSSLIVNFTKSKEEEIFGTNVDLFEGILNSSVDLNVFEGKDASSFSEMVGYVNGCLSVSSKRLVGLVLLGPLVQQSSSEQLQENCPSWLLLLTQILQPFGHLSHLRLSASLVKQLLKESSKHPDVSRKVANNLLQPLLEKALQMKDEQMPCGLEVLEGCMQYFPGPCGTMRNQIMNHVIRMLGQTDNDNAAEAAGRCLALLPSIGGGGTGGVAHQEAWLYYMTKLIKTVEDVLSELYKDWSSAFCSKVDPDKLIPLPYPPSNEPARTFSLAKQIQKIFHTMTEILQNPFPVAVTIPFQDLLSLVCNTVAVQGRTLVMSGSVQSSYLLMVLPSIYEAAFKLLTGLILRCGSHLLPHGGIINQLLLQTLNWTAAMEADQNQDVPRFRKLRCQVYEVYLDWQNTRGVAAFMGEKSDRLMEHLMTDAHLQEGVKLDSESIKSVSNESNASRKKKQKKQHQWYPDSNKVGSKYGETGDQTEKLCLLALKALRRMFFTCGTRLKWTVHRNYHTAAMRVILQCQNGLSFAISPYHYSANCRKELYHTLLASLLVPSPHWSAPFQSSIYLFSQGRLDKCVVVKEFCSEAAIICENIIHPRTPHILTPVIPDQNSVKASAPPVFSSFMSSGSLSIGGNVFQNDGISMGNTDTDILEEFKTEVMNGLQEKGLQTIDVDEGDEKSINVGGRVDESWNEDKGVNSEKDTDVGLQDHEDVETEESNDSNDDADDEIGNSKDAEDTKNGKGDDRRGCDDEGKLLHQGEIDTESKTAIAESGTPFASEPENEGNSRKRKAEFSSEDEGQKSEEPTVDDMLASFSSEAPDTDH